MSASALLVIRVLMRLLVRDRSGLRARSAFWRQFPAHECPRADQKGDTNNRRRGKRGEILLHEGYLDPCAQSRSATHRAGIARRPDTTGDVPALGTLPAAWRPPTGDHRATSRPAPATGPSRGRKARGSLPIPRGKHVPSGENLHRRNSMRVFPNVFGFTRSRSRNSATPSS
jgi:hypothetical protein